MYHIAFFFFFNNPPTTKIYPLSLHDPLPIPPAGTNVAEPYSASTSGPSSRRRARKNRSTRSEEHTSELQSQSNLVCRLLLEKKKIHLYHTHKCRSARVLVHHLIHCTLYIHLY